jgi:hypothetical protein
VYIDQNGDVKKDNILIVDPAGKTIQDAFLFDEVVAVKVTGFFFIFFSRPLTLNTYSNYLTNTPGSVTGDPAILAWDFTWDAAHGLECFAVKKGTLYKY